MKTSLILFSAIISLAVASRTSGAPPAADDAGDQLIDTVVNLLSDKDKDMQAIGLQQVREEVKGAAATKRFVELLPKLTPDARAGLIDALGARGDKTARGGVVEMLKSPEEQVRAAALRALGFLGEAGDVPLMAQSLTAGGEAEKTAAQRSLEQIRAEGVDEKIVGELKAAKDPGRQTALIEIVQRRKATAAVPVLLDLAVSDKADIRAAAMQALGQLAGAEDIPKLVEGIAQDRKRRRARSGGKVDHVRVCTHQRRQRASRSAAGGLGAARRRAEDNRAPHPGASRRPKGPEDRGGGNRRRQCAAPRCGRPSLVQLARCLGGRQAPGTGADFG